MGPAAGDGTRRKTACVPCGYGYVASALVKLLLEKGYAVKTTLRNPGKINSLIIPLGFVYLCQESKRQICLIHGFQMTW